MEEKKQLLYENFMREALKEAKKAFQKGDIPVGAVAVYEGRIIARGFNQMEMLHDPTAHAEMITMTQASAYVHEQGGDKHRGSLEKVSMYVTLEPCPMCAGAMVLNKCKTLVFGVRDPKLGACGTIHNIVQDDRLNHRLEVVSGILEEESKSLLQAFFKNLRKENR